MKRHAKAATAGLNNRQAGKKLAVPVALFAGLLALLVVVGSASAAKSHPFKELFGSAAQPTFTAAMGIAVDQSSGDVLVMDAGSPPSIKRFNHDGTPDEFSALSSNAIDGKEGADATPQEGLGFASASESQIAVDNSGGSTDGDIYVTQGSPNLINIFASTGAYLGQLTAAGATNFSEACGVAVDPAGAVYVGDYSGGIRKFVPAVNPVVNTDNTATFTTTTQPCQVAAGAGATAGFIFPAQYNGPISKIDSGTGELKYTVSADSNTTVTADPETGYVYGASGSNVNEYDASGAGSATQVSATKLSTNLQGVAVRGSTGDIFVSRNSQTKVEVFGSAFLISPDVTTTAATGTTATATTLNGSVNPDGAALTECLFEWGETTSYGETAPCVPNAAGIGSGTSPVPVHADLSGLNVGTTYHYRLRAANVGGPITGSDMSVLTTGPVIGATWSEGVLYTEASLKAEINPKGAATTYRVEYGETTAYGSQTPEFAVGSDSVTRTLTRIVAGLEPGTTYHYRVVATNSVATNEGPDRALTTFERVTPAVDCPNQSFRDGASAALPDCRAYEMVSPVDKNGGEIRGQNRVSTNQNGYFEQSSLNGNRVTFSSATSFADQASAANTNQYLASRGAAGWSTHGINLPRDSFLFPFLHNKFDLDSPFQAFNEDLSHAWAVNDSRAPLTSDGLLGYANLYQRDNLTNGLTALTTDELPTPGAAPVAENLRALGLEFGGASDDLSHQVYGSTGSSFSTSRVYDFADGELHLVSVLPDGTVASEPTTVGSLPRTGGVELGDNVRLQNFQNAVSDDGSRIFWSTYENNTVIDQVYVRENPSEPQSALDGGGNCTEAAKACTLEVSAVAPAGKEAQFWAASSDGSTALFDVEASDPSDNDVYRFDVDTETPTLIAHKVSGVAGASDDLSYVYFVSTEDIAAGATGGQPNVYVDHEGTVSFIAKLAQGLDVGTGQSGNTVSLINPSPFYRNSRVTPDGRHLAFVSRSKEVSEATADYDNTDAANGEPDMEVYLYKAGGDLTCVSCNPSGARPSGQRVPWPYYPRRPDAVIEGRSDIWAGAWIPTWGHSSYASRVISDDGNHIFFNAYDVLTPQDTNGEGDVYEWEAQGSGSCKNAGGCISLISTGESKLESEFFDASADGRDAFFYTASSIDPRDDGLFDVYDAREGGGYPLPVEPPPCLGDACQNVPAGPEDATPASAAFKGAGNSKPSSARNCGVRAKRASKLARKASLLRRRAKRSGSHGRARVLRGRSARYARKAKALNKQATRCRRNNRRAGR